MCSSASMGHVPCSILNGVRIVQLKAGFDHTPITTDENSSSVLKYKTPKFRAVATVDIPPLSAGEMVEVGWIQVCTRLLFVNEYGPTGVTSWELPELASGIFNMISDTDGKRYPWYGAKHEVSHLQGPQALSTLTTVNMLDHFRPQVTWYIPSASPEEQGSSKCRQPRLTSVYRHQRFVTFLAMRYTCSSLKNPSSEPADWSNIYILKSICWTIDVRIGVDPSAPLGRRVTFIAPVKQHDPIVLEADESPELMKNALHPPNANSSQMLVWWPAEHQHKPAVIINPQMSLISENEAKRTYLNSKGEHVAMLRSFSGRITQRCTYRPSHYGF